MSEIGLILALGCAAIANIGLLCQHRGAVRAPEIRFSHPLSSAAGLFRSRWWAIGFAIGCAAWGLHVAALAIAPLSLVQAVIAGGLAMLAFPARYWFGIALGRRELLGLGLAATGLAFLTLTPAQRTDAAGVYSLVRQLGFASGVALMSAVLRTRIEPNILALSAAADGIGGTEQVMNVATLAAYTDCFGMMALAAIAVSPGVLLFRARPGADKIENKPFDHIDARRRGPRSGTGP